MQNLELPLSIYTESERPYCDVSASLEVVHFRCSLFICLFMKICREFSVPRKSCISVRHSCEYTCMTMEISVRDYLGLEICGDGSIYPIEDDNRLIQIVLNSLFPTDKFTKHVKITIYKMRTCARYFTSDLGKGLPIKYQFPLTTDSCLCCEVIGLLVSMSLISICS